MSVAAWKIQWYRGKLSVTNLLDNHNYSDNFSCRIAEIRLRFVSLNWRMMRHQLHDWLIECWCFITRDTFYESLSLLTSPTRKSASTLLNLLSPRESCSGVWASSVTSFVLTPMRIIHMPSMLASLTRRRSGDYLVVALAKHGYAPSWMQNLGLWSARHRAYDRDLWREIVETATLLQSMLHDDDDDDNDDDNHKRQLDLEFNVTLLFIFFLTGGI